MNLMRISIFLFIIFILPGCDNNISTTTKTVNENIQYEMGVLPKLMSIPGKPFSVKWQIDESKERNTGNLVALLKYSDDDKNFIISNSKKYDNDSFDRIEAKFFDTWLPDAAKKSINIKKLDAVYELQGVVPMMPNLFTRTELSPYVNGSATPLSEGYILVLLYTM